MEILQIEEQIKTKSIPVLELEFLKYKVSFFSFGVTGSSSKERQYNRYNSNEMKIFEY